MSEIKDLIVVTRNVGGENQTDRTVIVGDKKVVARRWHETNPDNCIVMVKMHGRTYAVHMKPDQMRAFSMACILAAAGDGKPKD